MNKFIILNARGQGLHYIRGVQFWNDLNTFDNMIDCTRFSNEDAARAFVRDLNIPDAKAVAQIRLSVWAIEPVVKDKL